MLRDTVTYVKSASGQWHSGAGSYDARISCIRLPSKGVYRIRTLVAAEVTIFSLIGPEDGLLLESRIKYSSINHLDCACHGLLVFGEQRA
jgi:hypothetical protein